MTPVFKAKGYDTVWSQPAPPHTGTAVDEGTKRGMATGVSIHSLVPLRPSRTQLPDDVPATRITSAILHWGLMQIHCIAIYGYPSTTPQARQNTDVLMQAAATITHQVGLPTIVAGDFNMPLDGFPAFQFFEHRGFRSTKQLFPSIMNTEMPMTCRGTTCNDQILFDPVLLPYISSMQVDQLGPFHDHSPVIVDLTLPIEPVKHFVWSLPQSWVPYLQEPEKADDYFAQNQSEHYLNTPEQLRQHHTLDTALTAWAKTIEHAVSQTVHSQHQADPQHCPMPNLPRGARGRFSKIRLKQKQKVVYISKACEGQYNPKIDTANHHILLQTRQLRRLQSYYFLATKHDADPEAFHIRQQMKQEWAAITRAKGFQGFPQWCAHFPELGFDPFVNPDLTYVHSLIQLLRHHVDSLCAALNERRKCKAKAAMNFDKSHGSLRQTMQQVKGNASPPVQELEIPRRFEARLQSQGQGLVEIYIEQFDGFRLDRPAWYNEHLVHPMALDRHALTVMLDNADITLAPTGLRAPNSEHLTRTWLHITLYNKVHSRATQRKRHNIALSHLRRARLMKLDIVALSKISNFALQRALWGTHTHVVGQHWLNDLRTTIAKTLIPHKHASNPFLACAFATKHLDDPTQYLIWDNFRTVRQYLTVQPFSVRQEFLATVATHSTKHSDVWGPSGAFAYNLARIGWQCDRHGRIFTDTPQEFDLLLGDLKEIRQAMNQSWIRYVFQCKLQRKEWQQLPVPDRQATLNMLHTLTPSQHKAAMYAISGASMTAHQIGKFTDRSDQCALCDMDDSREHRVLHCQATAHVRSSYPELLEWLMDMNPVHLHMPVLFEPPHSDFANWYYQRVASASFADEDTDYLLQACHAEETLHIYTDGSCVFPSQPQKRRAAFALVLLKGSFDTPTFHTLAVAECKGRQTIDRAELQAVLCLADWCHRHQVEASNIHVHTDSSYVIRSHQLILAPTQNADFQLLKYNSTDLLHHLRDSAPAFHLHKIKAHQQLREEFSLEQRCHVLGNHAVDQAAKQALQHFLHTIPLHEDMSPDHEKYLHQHYEYLANLQHARAILFQALETQQPLGTRARSMLTQVEQLLNWHPEQPDNHAFFDRLPLYKLHDFLWGTRYGHQLLQWMRQLTWPRQPDPLQAGITWFELTMSFLWYTQEGVVVNTGGKDDLPDAWHRADRWTADREQKQKRDKTARAHMQARYMLHHFVKNDHDHVCRRCP
eukprot:Skav219540  [mRNA]  locus=scaffold556:77175:84289:- [translate_table: standard]